MKTSPLSMARLIRDEWRSLDNFKEITRDAAANNLVPQGELYFGTLITALEYVSQ